jgi:hypothetical protein
MTLQPFGIEKSHMAVLHGQRLSYTGENVRKMFTITRTNALHLLQKE